ncbi:MAG: aromatic aminobenezylarsenical efflux permease ArsG family transporter [Firmicutes bacterium]|nr:aromatic aminobenezylarsenical efflux permease ArsG family transporter [Bacillota bacterium]
MDSYFLSLTSAIWLGILTSISPCPLASNIAAISYIGKSAGQGKNVLLSGLFYTLGRACAYLAVGIIITSSLLTIPAVAMFLQTYMNKILGPILLIAGVILLDVIPLTFMNNTSSALAEKASKTGGPAGAFLMGVIFALAFCPVSAALFFGSLIPLTIKFKSGIIMPVVYGIGTALPVVFFAFLIAFSIQSVGKAFNKLKSVEVWARKITGVIFILAGLYLILVYIMGINFYN